MHKMVLLLGGLSVGLLLLFSNCGRVGHPDLVTSSSLSAAASQCEAQLKAVYASTYFPFFQSTCTTCHQHKQTHASSDVSVSYSAFMLTGETKIIEMATRPHGGNQFGSANQQAINVFKPSWDEAKAAYEQCVASQGSGGGTDPGRTSVIIRDRIVLLQAKEVPELSKSETNSALWTLVQWNLSEEVTSSDLRRRISGDLSLEVKFWRNLEGRIIGLMVRNPRLRLSVGAERISVGGIRFYLNQVLSLDGSYENLNRLVEGGQDVNLSASALGLNFPNIKADVKVAVEFTKLSIGEGIQAGSLGSITGAGSTPMPTPIPGAPPAPTPTPTPLVPITFTDLVSGAANVRVFGNYCTNCHRAGNALGGLDLTQYNQALGRASQILNRMTDANRPMPPAGLLPAVEVDKVRRWVQAGAPR